jgi:hypothetical protein
LRLAGHGVLESSVCVRQVAIAVKWAALNVLGAKLGGGGCGIAV